MDIGTGDGRYIYRSARANPAKFYIGIEVQRRIDVQRRALEKVSEKVHRKSSKGGLANVLLLHAPVEDLPAELDHVADEIHIHFPWDSLLRSVAVGDERVLRNVRRITAQGAWLEVLIGVDEDRDAREVERLRRPAPDRRVPFGRVVVALRAARIRSARGRHHSAIRVAPP